MELVSCSNKQGVGRVTAAMMKMKKLDVIALKKAYDGYILRDDEHVHTIAYFNSKPYRPVTPLKRLLSGMILEVGLFRLKCS